MYTQQLNPIRRRSEMLLGSIVHNVNGIINTDVLLCQRAEVRS